MSRIPLGFASDGASIRRAVQLQTANREILQLQPDFEVSNYYCAVDNFPMLVYIGRDKDGTLREVPIAGNLSMQDMLQCVNTLLINNSYYRQIRIVPKTVEFSSVSQSCLVEDCNR